MTVSNHDQKGGLHKLSAVGVAGAYTVLLAGNTAPLPRVISRYLPARLPKDASPRFMMNYFSQNESIGEKK